MDKQRVRKMQSKAAAMGYRVSTSGPGVPLNVQALMSLVPSQRAKIAAPQPAPMVHNALTADENTRFLQLVASCAQISTHYELFALVQGELQYFLPQDILIAAWGDFGAQDPQIDVISNLPGVRTERICDDFVPLAKFLHEIWIDGGAQPMLVNKKVAEVHGCVKRHCSLPCAFPGMKLTLVHGTRNKRDGYDSLYIALRRQSVAINGAEARFHFLADSIIQQVDVAYRKVATLGAPKAAANEFSPSALLSVREEEITSWVCQGKTNAQVAHILGISVNTVKNHVHRIFDKLGANNRTQAVAKYRSIAGSAESDLTQGKP